MIQALPEQPGFLSIVDEKGRRHTVSVFAMGKPQATGTSAVYLKFTRYKSLFVRCTLEEVRAAAKRARALRDARQASSQRAQLAFDFDKETADQLPTESAAANTHQADEACNAGS